LNEGFDPRFVSALLVLYAAGIGAVAGGNYAALQALLLEAFLFENEREIPVGIRIFPNAVFQPQIGHLLKGFERDHTPLSHYLEAALRESLRPVITADRAYVDAFDRFEYLVALVRADYELQQSRGGWAPIGCFGWRRRIMKVIDKEIETQGVTWPAFRLFGGTSFDRLTAAREVIKQIIPASWGW
jgi:hypothetical protein